MADAVLTVNAGSSSLKFAVWRIGADDRPDLSAKGQVEGIGTSPRLAAEDAAGRVLVERRWQGDRSLGHAEFFRVIGGWLREHLGEAALLGVGHRVVHGGIDHAAPVRVDPAVHGEPRGALPAGAAASAAQPRRHPRGRRGPAGPAAGRLLRHRLPPQPPRARRLVRPAPPLLRRRHPPLRLPRPVLRVHRERAARGRARDRRGPRRRRPSRQRRQHVRDPRRTQRRQHDGLHRARRPADGHALRRARPGRRAPPDARLRHGRGCDRAPALPGLRPQGRLRHRQRHAHAARERRPACRAGDRALRLADRPRARRARRRARRPRRPRLHRRDRRALGRDPRAGLRARRLARHRARRGGQPRRRAPHLGGGQQGRGLRDPDRRGADDRPPHAGRAAPGANRREPPHDPGRKRQQACRSMPTSAASRARRAW